MTARGPVRNMEPLFPCYIFVRCVITDKLEGIKHANGISSLVQFGGKISIVEDSIILELQGCFADEPMTPEHRLVPGSEVCIAGGAFNGARAYVLRNLPARQRVQVLLDILGQPTPIEVDRSAVILMENTMPLVAPISTAQVSARV